MTERTYTETEVRAMRAAVLRQAAEIPAKGMSRYQFREAIIAMIDQPAEDAVNAMIGAAYEAASQISDAGDLGIDDDRDKEARKIAKFIREATPADAIAALERVKQAELERCADIAARVLREYAAEQGNTKTPGGRTAIFYKRKVVAAIMGERE